MFTAENHPFLVDENTPFYGEICYNGSSYVCGNSMFLFKTNSHPTTAYDPSLDLDFFLEQVRADQPAAMFIPGWYFGELAEEDLRDGKDNCMWAVLP